jgi:hypothetical protein
MRPYQLQLYSEVGKTTVKTHLSFIHIRGLDVIHNINMNVIQHDISTGIRAAGSIVDHVSENDTGLGRRNLDGGLDVMECVRAKRVRRGTLHKLQVTESSELDSQVLKRLTRLVDNEYICEIESYQSSNPCSNHKQAHQA